MENPLSRLALDAWYKVIIVIGAFVVLLNGAGLLPSYPTRETFMIGLGCVIWGVAEWMNHPLNETAYPRTANMPAHKFVDYSWSPGPIGILLDVIGLGLIAWGLIKLL
ncbi:hypothetical protein [Erwinia pyrifoliae]|uniref:Uncharacterized protein n=2 Tax=Erwinia pyrifoliae TaxID=79967 RepID=A0ABY5X3L6_ERWPY|nr:hypothetical protein [Erwinia pyrifoliae]MCT2385136.1 hypothetical protein [Erwinia pyrifoliae]MCT2388763.1 hypothetical protein [Erwinia pyrifoliae]UWS31972.1 hypothetical protein NYP84_09800 [Erwinia pyrifoliae]UXK13816.1 hypothetical protein NYP80_08455 [Erwinia pyrifoliae]